MQDLNDKINNGGTTAAGQLDADEWNQIPSEIQNAIEGAGITLSGGDLNQLGKAIAEYVANGNFYTDSGVANAYILTSIGSKQSITAYTDGAEFDLITANPNTGASTVNVAALGIKDIKLGDGSNPTAGQVDGRVKLRFDLANDRCELILSGMVTSSIILANTTYNPPSGVKSLKFTAIGGGGGGGGCDGQGAATLALGAGGAGAGTSIKTTSRIEASYAIVIGAAGVGGAAGVNDGATGGATTVVSADVNLTANGGAFGTGTLGVTDGAGGGRPGGTASGGDINMKGNPSTSYGIVSGGFGSIPNGGTSLFSGAGRARVTNSSGEDADGYGCGGSGGTSLDVASNFAGGDGFQGVVIIEEFF